MLLIIVSTYQPPAVSRTSASLEPGESMPVQLGIGGLIDLSHAPFANEGSDVVVAESGADLQGHGL